MSYLELAYQHGYPLIASTFEEVKHLLELVSSTCLPDCPADCQSDPVSDW